jgi:hypothetical protein
MEINILEIVITYVPIRKNRIVGTTETGRLAQQIIRHIYAFQSTRIIRTLEAGQLVVTQIDRLQYQTEGIVLLVGKPKDEIFPETFIYMFAPNMADITKPVEIVLTKNRQYIFG